MAHLVQDTQPGLALCELSSQHSEEVFLNKWGT